MISERVGVLVVLVSVGLVGGCGDRGSEPAAVPTATAPATTPARGVLYDGNWEVEETGWYLGDSDFDLDLPLDATSSNGLLQEAGPDGLWVTTPGLYGAYPAQVTVYDSEPTTPPACEDVVEAPLQVGESGAVVVGGFESSGEPFEVGAGDFRVRLCATGLDEAFGEPEFDGDDDDDLGLHVSASRFEFQMWPAPMRPGEIAKVGSEFARGEHARVAAAHTST